MSAALAVGQLVEAAGALPAAIPSPPQHTWYVGPFPIRAYALAILAGIAVALWLTRRRWVERGGEADDVLEIAFWAVPFGIIGGRLYHVFSTPDPYWGPNGDPVRALYVWEGGLGIWGAVALGAVGAYIGCRRQRVSFPAFAASATGSTRSSSARPRRCPGGCASTTPWPPQPAIRRAPCSTRRSSKRWSGTSVLPCS